MRQRHWLGGFMVIALSVGASHSSGAPDHTAQAALVRAATPISAADNFYEVTPTLFRSQQLDAHSGALLAQLGIKTVINLRYFHRDGDLGLGPNVRVVHVPLVTWSISPKEVAQALWRIRQAQALGKVLVHCHHGADRTGLVVGMYRIIEQNWSIAAARHEMREGGFGHHKIWINLSRSFTPQFVAQVRAQLAQMPKTAP